MKIAVPTEATAGTTIATHPIRIATIPIAISAFQVLRRPSCASGSAAKPPISMTPTLGVPADAITALLWAIFIRAAFAPYSGGNAAPSVLLTGEPGLEPG